MKLKDRPRITAASDATTFEALANRLCVSLGRRSLIKGGRSRRVKEDHRSLTLWAADCAEHVLPHFEENYPEDARPRRAIEAARAWTRGEIRCGEARAAAVAAHAAARGADEDAACAAARAAGHAAATAHAASHARHAAAYAAKAAISR